MSLGLGFHLLGREVVGLGRGCTSQGRGQGRQEEGAAEHGQNPFWEIAGSRPRVRSPKTIKRAGETSLRPSFTVTGTNTSRSQLNHAAVDLAGAEQEEA